MTVDVITQNCMFGIYTQWKKGKVHSSLEPECLCVVLN